MAAQPHSWSRLSTAVAKTAHGAGPHRRSCSCARSRPHRTLTRPASERTPRSTQRTLGGFLPSLPSILSLSFCAKSVLIISICAHAPALRRQQAPAVRGSRSQLPGPSCPFGFVILWYKFRKTNLILGVFLIRPVPQSRAASRKGDIRES